MLCSSFRLESQFEMSPSYQKVSTCAIHWKTNCDPIHGDSNFKILILNQSNSFEHIPVFFSPKEKSRWSHTQWHLSTCHGVGYCFQGHPRRRSDPTNDSKTWRLPKSAEAPKSNTNTQSFMAFQPSWTKWTPNGQLKKKEKAWKRSKRTESTSTTCTQINTSYVSRRTNSSKRIYVDQQPTRRRHWVFHFLRLAQERRAPVQWNTWD